MRIKCDGCGAYFYYVIDGVGTKCNIIAIELNGTMAIRSYTVTYNTGRGQGTSTIMASDVHGIRI